MKPHYYVSGPYARRSGRRTVYRVALKFFRELNRLDWTYDEETFGSESAAAKCAAKMQTIADARNAALAMEDRT